MLEHAIKVLHHFQIGIAQQSVPFALEKPRPRRIVRLAARMGVAVQLHHQLRAVRREIHDVAVLLVLDHLLAAELDVGEALGAKLQPEPRFGLRHFRTHRTGALRESEVTHERFRTPPLPTLSPEGERA